MVETAHKIITEADLLALGEDVWAEVVNGELRTSMTPHKAEHGFVAQRIGTFFDTFVAVRNLGRVFSDMTAFILEGDAQSGVRGSRVPDVSFVSYDRLGREESLDRLLAVVPDIAVEVISESETHAEVLDKLNDYLDAGVRMVLHVIARRREIHVFTADSRAGIILKEGDTLDGGDVLPGFCVPVRAVFDQADPDLQASVLRALLDTE